MSESIFLDYPTARPAADFPGAENQPLHYPGTRPETSYCYAAGRVLPLLHGADGSPRVDFGDDSQDLNAFLRRFDEVPTERRFALLAVGSNACPGRLLEKYAGPMPNTAIPVLKGHMRDLDTVYLSQLAKYAAFPATGISSPGTDLEIWANLLSGEQAALMTRQEQTDFDYRLVKAPAPFRWAGWTIDPAYLYYDPAILDLGNGPIRLSAFSARNPSHPALEQEAILVQVLDAIGFHPGKPIEERQRILRSDRSLLHAMNSEIRSRFRMRQSVDPPGREVRPEEMVFGNWRRE